MAASAALRIQSSAFPSVSSSEGCWDGDHSTTKATVLAFRTASSRPLRSSRVELRRDCVNSFRGQRRSNEPIVSLKSHDLVDATEEAAQKDTFRQLKEHDFVDATEEDTFCQLKEDVASLKEHEDATEDTFRQSKELVDAATFRQLEDPVTSAECESLETDNSEAAAVQQQRPNLLFTRNKEERKVVRTAWEKLVRWSRSWQLLNARRKNALKKTKKVVVLGGGSFGTAMAVLLARNKADMNVTLLLRDSTICDSINDHHVNNKYFPRHQLPKNVTATTDPKLAMQDAQYCVHAIPVQSSTAFLHAIAEHVPATLPFLSVCKGLELSTLEMMSQLIPRALNNPRQPVAVISGPSFAIELMDELPTAMVAASRDKELAKACQQLLASHYLRVGVGVEMAGAFKHRIMRTHSDYSHHDQIVLRLELSNHTEFQYMENQGRRT